MNQNLGKILIICGILLAIAGLIIYFFGKHLGFLGKLPGDIRIEREGGSFYFPLVTCILLSVAITAIIKIVQYFSR